MVIRMLRIPMAAHGLPTSLLLTSRSSRPRSTPSCSIALQPLGTFKTWGRSGIQLDAPCRFMYHVHYMGLYAGRCRRRNTALTIRYTLPYSADSSPPFGRAATRPHA